jgi:predicted nuclease of restriction endonuclease-like (RecB) superfamily
LLKRLSNDLGARLGRAFGVDNLQRMRSFYLAWRPEQIYATLSRKSASTGIEISISQKSRNWSAESGIGKSATVSGIFALSDLAQAFRLPWSHYVRLLTVKNHDARAFYEVETLRNGWSARQLNRQISSLFYERTALSKNKADMLTKAARATPEDQVTAEEELNDPYVLELLDLKDEYSESDLEEGPIRHLEHFLLELGGDFAFIGRQKRLRIGGEWYRVDLIFFHRRLRGTYDQSMKDNRSAHFER